MPEVNPVTFTAVGLFTYTVTLFKDVTTANMGKEGCSAFGGLTEA